LSATAFSIVVITLASTSWLAALSGSLVANDQNANAALGFEDVWPVGC